MRQGNLSGWKVKGSSDSEDSEDYSYHDSDDELPAVPEYWTRVKSRDQLLNERVQTHNIHVDMKDFKVKERHREGQRINGDLPIFDGEAFNGTGFIFSKAK